MATQLELEGLNLSRAFYSKIEVTDSAFITPPSDDPIPVSSSLVEFTQTFPQNKREQDTVSRISRIVRALGGDDHCVELAQAYNFHLSDVTNFIVGNFNTPEHVTPQDAILINGVQALVSIEECQARQNGNGRDLEPYIAMAYDFNGGFKRALIVKAAESIDQLNRVGLPDSFKKIEHDLDLYIVLLGLVEESEGVKHIKDLYVEKKYPHYLDLYNQAICEIAGGSQNRREFIETERQPVNYMHNELRARLVAGGLEQVDRTKFESRISAALEAVNAAGDLTTLDDVLSDTLGEREFYISPIREKSIGSVVLKAMRYVENEAFRKIYAREHGGQEPSLDSIETWKYVLTHTTDCHGFRIIFPNGLLRDEVQSFLTNAAFGKLREIGITESTFYDARNEHFIDDKSQDPESKIGLVNVVMQDPEKSLPFEVQLMTTVDYFNYCYGIGNHVSYKQKELNISPKDVCGVAAAVKKG